MNHPNHCFCDYPRDKAGAIQTREYVVCKWNPEHRFVVCIDSARVYRAMLKVGLLEGEALRFAKELEAVLTS